MAEHFTTWAWAGYASQSVSAADAAAMRGHLGDDCPHCVREFGFWRSLRSTVRASRQPLPAGSLARALAVFQPRTAPAPLAPPWRLAFDSWHAPQAHPVRSAAARRLSVYELDGAAGAESLEVMVERVGPDQAYSVVGQVLGADGQGWCDCVVELAGQTAAEPVSAQGRTNQFGEFSFVQAGVRPLRLDLLARGKRWGIAPLLLP